MPKILFDNTHTNGAIIDDNDEEGLYLFAEELKKNGFEVESIEEQFILSLSKADVLVVPFPQEPFSSEQKNTILNFVKNGKGLLLTAEYGNLCENAVFLNEISKTFGTIFSGDRITDNINVYRESIEFKGTAFTSQKIPQFVKINGFVNHSITQGIKEIMHYAGCSLETDNVIAFSPMTSFRDKDIDSQREKYEESGNFPTASAVNFEKGRVVCLGDTSLLSNKYVGRVDNKKFGVNIIKWLSKQI